MIAAARPVRLTMVSRLASRCPSALVKETTEAIDSDDLCGNLAVRRQETPGDVPRRLRQTCEIT